MKSLILLISIGALAQSCSPFAAYKTAEMIVMNYPSDNIVEEVLEDKIEGYFELEEGSVDLSPFSPEEK